MANFERMREVFSVPPDLESIRQRTAEGWQLVAIDWERELSAGAAAAEEEFRTEAEFEEDVPYGLRISADHKRLEADPDEHRVLMEMMQMLAEDCSYTGMVQNLNSRGYHMRNGRPWDRIAVFRMLPRLIEVGPSFFSSTEWQQRRQRFSREEAGREAI
jgi:Recombinase